LNTGAARRLLERYAAGVAYVEIEHCNGDRGIGTATHIGNGVYVSARHVLDGNRIVKVASTERECVRLGEATSDSHVVIDDGDDRYAAHSVHNENMRIIEGPVFHPNENVDLAAFRCDGVDELTPWVPLGGHLDDWLGISDFVLHEVILMGYPPIPMTRDPRLIASRAEISGLVDFYDVPHVHFLLSAMARGGYSGAMVIDEGGYGLGVVTRSVGNDGPEELGYMACVSVEPIYEMLASSKLLPTAQFEIFDGLWNTNEISLVQILDDGLGQMHRASVGVFDDGKRLWLDINVFRDPDELESASRLAMDGLRDYPFSVEKHESYHRIRLLNYGPQESETLDGIQETVLKHLESRLEGVTRSRWWG
jgi:Trypsin-like peptidase domain